MSLSVEIENNTFIGSGNNGGGELKEKIEQIDHIDENQSTAVNLISKPDKRLKRRSLSLNNLGTSSIHNSRSGNMNQQSETQPPLKTDASTQTNTENYRHVILVDNTKSDEVQITYNAVNTTVLLTEEDELVNNSILNSAEFKNLKNAKDNKIIVIKKYKKNAQYLKPNDDADSQNDDKQIVVEEESVSSEFTEETVKVPTETTVINPPRPQSPLSTNIQKNSMQLTVNIDLAVKNGKNHKRELPPSEDLPLKPAKRTYSRKSSVDNVSQDQIIDLTTDDDDHISSANVAAVRRPNSRNLNVTYKRIKSRYFMLRRMLCDLQKKVYPEAKIINSDEFIVIEDD